MRPEKQVALELNLGFSWNTESKTSHLIFCSFSTLN
ncbi:MAG: Uncharacterised protein [Marinobacterium sp. xm-d-530]|nr:MAG: Uncharacterised protein [Marinobacterium sp. xm-d-530]